MLTHAAKAEKTKAATTAERATVTQNQYQSSAAVVNNRPAAEAQRRTQDMINQSLQVQQAAALQDQITQSPRQQQAAQRKTVALVPAGKKANKTGLPDKLKAGVENLSGYSLDDVQVHYNSDKPTQMQAHAYAHGTDIHVATGQEKHLPHEAWHVVQQKQGRVRPTRQLKSKVAVNDDAGLEKEADVMGAKASFLIRVPTNSPLQNQQVNNAQAPMQGNWWDVTQLSLEYQVGLSVLVIAAAIFGVFRLLHFLTQTKDKGKKLEDNLVSLTKKEKGSDQVDLVRKPLLGPTQGGLSEQDDSSGGISDGKATLVTSDKEETSERSLKKFMKRGYSLRPIDWQKEFSKKARYESQAKLPSTYVRLLSSGKLERETGTGTKPKRKAAASALVFSPITVDLIIEGSTAYEKDNCLVFLYEPDQTVGYMFEGKPNDIVKWLAVKYAHMHEQPNPRSGKARAADDSMSGTFRERDPKEADYKEGAREAKLQEEDSAKSKKAKRRNAKGSTSIEKSESDTGSRVIVEHTAPWDKGDRGSGQQSAMGGWSAKNYIVSKMPEQKGVTREKMLKDLEGRFEWLHVVGSSLGGTNILENLVAGSYDANTKMIALEHRVARWSDPNYFGEHRPTDSKPIRITGEAKTVKGTRIGERITLSIEHGKQKLATGEYKVNDQKVITKSEYANEEKRVNAELEENTQVKTSI